MAQIYYVRFMIYVLPTIIGLILGICLWKIKKTYFLSGVMFLVGVVWWGVLSCINTHGSEGPGILACMYSLVALSFTVVEVIKKLSKKQKMKIGITIVISLLLIVVISVAGYIYTRPVEWDAGACGGGYVTWIFDKYSEELTASFLNGMGEKKGNVISVEAVRGTQSADWEDKQIFLEFNIKYTHKTNGDITEKVQFIGTRYWIDSFKWSGAIVFG